MSGLRLRLPATSANLGPGFDTLALALDLYLEIEAQAASEWSIRATGRNPEVCSRVEGNLILAVYRKIWERYGSGEPRALALDVNNGIPLGMGCGSSAASRLAGVALAAHFGKLGWSRERILDEACALEGHPDNAAACWLGGFVASGYDPAETLPSYGTAMVRAVTIAPPEAWHALLVFPEKPLATTESRAVLPETYSRGDIVANLQSLALLVAAFASGRAELLRAGTADCIHQPYRGKVCPILPALLPLAGQEGILSVTLSGAGSGVLLLLDAETRVARATELIRKATESVASQQIIDTILACFLGRESASMQEVTDR